jgi:hypothetical protein
MEGYIAQWFLINAFAATRSLLIMPFVTGASNCMSSAIG